MTAPTPVVVEPHLKRGSRYDQLARRTDARILRTRSRDIEGQAEIPANLLDGPPLLPGNECELAVHPGRGPFPSQKLAFCISKVVEQSVGHVQVVRENERPAPGPPSRWS